MMQKQDMSPVWFTSTYWEDGYQFQLLQTFRDKHVRLIGMLREKQRSLRFGEDVYQLGLLDVKVLADSDLK